MGVKSEPDMKRARGLGTTPSSSHFNFQDPRTVVLELRDYLKVCAGRDGVVAEECLMDGFGHFDGKQPSTFDIPLPDSHNSHS